MSMVNVLESILEALGVSEHDARLSFHVPLRTADDAERLTADSGAVNLKSTVWCDSWGALVVVTVGVADRVAVKAVREVTGLGRLRMADDDILRGALGVEPGAVSPFGYGENVACVIDAGVLGFSDVLISPGRCDATLKLGADDFGRLVDVFRCRVATVSAAMSSAVRKPQVR